MGLDMYAFTLVSAPAAAVDFQDHKARALHRWRKHANLYGWMRNLYFEKGGPDEVFNCSNVLLTMDDLERLERAIHNNGLPKTEGFFFGASDGSERDDDLAFVAKARAAIASGLAVGFAAFW